MTTYTIKPLVWAHTTDVHAARTPFSRLYVYPSYFDGTFRARHDLESTTVAIGHKHESIAAAKAACVEHWENMIKQALEEYELHNAG